MTIFTKPFVLTVIFLLLLGNVLNVFATNSVSVVTSIADNTQTHQNEKTSLVFSGQHWQIKPNENIFQIAQLIYPNNSTARKSLVRAIIQTNPQLFPGGAYQPIATGTVVYIPDLRTIGNYAKPIHKKQNKPVRDISRSHSSPNAADNPTSTIEHHDGFVQRLSHLEQGAENSTNDLHKLNKHIDTLAAQITTLQLAAQTINVNPNTLSDGIKETENFNTVATTDSAQSFEKNVSTVLPAETLTNTVPVIESESETEYSVGSFIDTNLLLLAGLLLALLFAIILLRRYRGTKNRHPQTEYDVTHIQPIDRHGLYGLFKKKGKLNDDMQHSEHSATQSTDMALLAREMIQRGESRHAAIQFLQKQLAIDRLDVHGWLQLFELLYQSGNKTDFKKNARRFKRLNEFPDIWAQIQALGNRLEPNEPLYFDDQKRQEKFFSDTPSSSLE